MQDYDIKDIFNLPIKIQFAVVGVLCLVVFYLAYQWDFSSLKRELLSAQTEEKDLKIQFQSLEENLNTLNKEIAQLPQLQALLKKWQTQLITAENLPDLLNDILKIGVANQVQFQFFNPGSAIIDNNFPFYARVPINIVSIADYHQVANFMSQIANMPTLVAIGSFEMTKGQNKLYDKKEAQEPGYADRITTQMVLEIYNVAPKQPVKEPVKHAK